jgi:hypothetical protein
MEAETVQVVSVSTEYIKSVKLHSKTNFELVFLNKRAQLIN